MASYKMLEMNRKSLKSLEPLRKLQCTKCGIVMGDIEPYAERGDFWHPDNGCVNGGKSYDHSYDPFRQKSSPSVHGLIRVGATSSETRARKRGAKAASKRRGSR